VDYRVQIMTSDRKVPKNSSRFGPYRGEVTEMITGGVYKYYVGCVASYKEALSLQSKLRSQFKDAFVVPFLGDKRITIAEARRLE
jgi:N-acetylmuramoyl-L-alanine amidase